VRSARAFGHLEQARGFAVGNRDLGAFPTMRACQACGPSGSSCGSGSAGKGGGTVISGTPGPGLSRRQCGVARHQGLRGLGGALGVQHVHLAPCRITEGHAAGQGVAFAGKQLILRRRLFGHGAAAQPAHPGIEQAAGDLVFGIFQAQLSHAAGAAADFSIQPGLSRQADRG
jgi:hypothetical protein